MENDLKSFGLSKNEVRVYLFLIERGVSSPSEIAAGTGIALTNSYHVIAKLKIDGLLLEQRVGKRKRYSAAEPEAMLRNFDLKREALQRVLPDINLLYKNQRNKPLIRFFDGLKGLENVFTEVLEADEKLFGIASTAKLFEEMPSFFTPWRKRLKAKGIFLKDILTSDSASVAAVQTKKELGVFYEYKILPASYGNMATDILIWNNRVALMTLEKPLFATVIEDPHLAKTFRLMWNATWASAQSST